MAMAVAEGGALLTLEEAADRLGVHYMTAYRYVRTGRLAAAKFDGRWWVEPAVLASLAPGRISASRRGDVKPALRRDQLAARLLAGDEAGAWAVTQTVLQGGTDPPGLYLDVICPAMSSIGARWARGELDVADEHLASAVLSRLLGRLGPLFVRPGPKRGVVVLGGVPGDLHGLPGHVLADLVRDAGYEVNDLGANVPAASFVAAASSTPSLRVVALTATTSGRDEHVSETIAALRRSRIGAPVLVGGRAIRDAAHAERLGADGGGAIGRAAVDLVVGAAG